MEIVGEIHTNGHPLIIIGQSYTDLEKNVINIGAGNVIKNECIIIGNNCVVEESAKNCLIIGNNITASEPNKVYISNEFFTDIFKELKELRNEVKLLREMITWHPDNNNSISSLKTNFETLNDTLKDM